MTFTIREATAADALAIARVRAQGWREAYSHLLTAETLARVDAGIDVRAAGWAEAIAGGQVIQVLEVEGEVRGFAIGGEPESDERPRETQLSLLYILASEYGTGAGQALLDAAIGDGPAFLWTAEDNPRARAFYARNGFVPDGAREVREWLDNLVEIRMVRD